MTVLFILTLASFNLYSQENNRLFERLTEELNVTNNHIGKILQDKKGYLWLTSRDGLLKYDGYTVTKYQYKPFDPNSVPQNVVYTLFIDKTDTMWLGTPEGLTIFDQRLEKFIRLTTSSISGMPDLGNVSAISEDGIGNLWIGNYEGKLWRFNRKNQKFLPLSSKLGFQYKKDSLADIHEVIFKIYKDKKDVMWIGTSAGLFRVDSNSAKFVDVSFTRFQHDPSKDYSLKCNSVADIYEDRKGVLWINTSSPKGIPSLPGLSQFDRATGKFTFFPNSPNDSTKKNSNEAWWAGEILEDSSGTLWVADRYTLRSLNKERTAFTNWFKRENNPTIKATRIYALGLDGGGNLFVSTSIGLQRLTLHQKPFRLLQHKPTDKIPVTIKSVLSVAEDQSGDIWIGTNDGGLNKWNKDSQTITSYKHKVNDRGSLKSNNVAGIIAEANGDLWACNGEYLSCLKKGSQAFKHFNIKSNDSEKTEILSVCQDRDGIIWLGTTNGIKSFDRISEQFTHYFRRDGDSLGISDYTAISIFADSRGNVWVGTGSKAFNKFNKTTGRFTHYKNKPADTSSISSNIIQSVFEDSKGNLWIGTNGGGLCQYNYKNDNFTTHTRNKDLSWNTVYSIVEDNKGNLWLGTEKGLSWYLISQQKFINYDVRDGLQSDLFAAGSTLRGSACVGKDGTIYFGGDHGLNYFDPAQIHPNNYKPPIVITKFKIFDKLRPGQNEEKKIKLKYNQNFFSFEFAALNYTIAQKNQYAYQLEGFDPDWIYSGSRRYASYTNLDPGEYTFKVKGSNNDEIWNEEGISVRLVILPPWWKTWWAYTIYGLLFVAGVLMVHRYQKERVIQAEREKAREKELAHAKEIEKAYKELEHTQAQLIHAAKMASLGEITAGIAHEIQNPLNFVNNFSEINNELIGELKNAKDKNERNEELEKTLLNDISQNLEKISYHGKRADGIVKNMLQHSRSSAGKTEPTNINSLANDYVRLAYHNLRAKSKSFNAKFETNFDLSIGKINVVPQEIGRVLLNLINNAFYAACSSPAEKIGAYAGDIPESLPNEIPTVWVSTRKEKNNVLISIRDNGPGIPSKFLDKIFQPFFTTKPTGQGTGLGLSLSYDIVKAHGGELKVETEEGQGSEFIVQLPLA